MSDTASADAVPVYDPEREAEFTPIFWETEDGAFGQASPGQKAPEGASAISEEAFTEKLAAFNEPRTVEEPEPPTDEEVLRSLGLSDVLIQKILGL